MDKSNNHTNKVTWNSRSIVYSLLFLSSFLSLPKTVILKPLVSTSPKPDPTLSAMLYLSEYGWLDKSNMKTGGSVAAPLLDMSGAIREFQAFAGLNQTGLLDVETIELMNTPRCGVKDRIGHDARRRKKRYVLQGSRWKVSKLTYRLTKYPSKLTRSEVDNEIENAFNIWEAHTNLTFQKSTTGKVHIEIQFQKQDHGDGDPFDGEGGTLAHAYFPVYGGDAHFDDEEKWTIKSYRGTNLFQVAAHEFGHSLGLSHSDVKSALMAPFYRGYQPSFKLDQDDIFAIQKLYGKKESSVRPPSPSPSKIPIIPNNNNNNGKEDEICLNTKLDAITTLGDGNTYAFKGSKYYKLTETGIEIGYPKNIKDDFGIDGYLDSGFTWTNDKSYFFKGSKYWRYTNFKMDPGYPKDISDGFEGIPSNIDAVFVWGGNGKIYFFKGTQYWRFDPLKRPPVSLGYPKQISNWEGIPNNIDAALRYSNGNTYFFKNDKYWRFNDKNFAVDDASPAFPRSSNIWWFGCGKSNKDSPLSMTNSEELLTPSPNFLSNEDDDADGGSNKSHASTVVASHFIASILIIILCI